MSFESFLQFWTLHNRQIIEFVFVSTFILILFTIYRQFFAKGNSAGGDGHQANSVSIDTSEIEEKLKKILENQSGFKPATTDTGASGAASAASAASVAEIEKLRVDLKEKEKTIEDLKKTSGSASVPGAKEDSKKWEDKVKELEGRLQEYEIISEDIADLSFYKEENARLQKELSSKGSTPASAAEPTAEALLGIEPAVAEIPEPEPVVAVATPPQPTKEATPVDAAPVAAEAGIPTDVAVAADAVKETEASKAADEIKAADSVVDDDILKEFAAAVEGQKKQDTAPAQNTPPVQELDPQKLTESKELMGEFENFIKKG